MIDPSHIEARKREAIKQGRGYWSADLDLSGDLDRFYQEYVLPLRELSREGALGPLKETEGLSKSGVRITSVHIKREIDFSDSE